MLHVFTRSTLSSFTPPSVSVIIRCLTRFDCFVFLSSRLVEKHAQIQQDPVLPAASLLLRGENAQEVRLTHALGYNKGKE